MNKGYLSTFAVLVLLSACGSQPAEETSEVFEIPAFIPEPSSTSQQLITDAVISMTQNSQVQLGPDAFAEGDTLILHRTQLTGRDLGTVERFRLISIGENCYLIYENSGARSDLQGLDCAPYLTESPEQK